MPIEDMDPGTSPEAPGTWSFFKQGSATSTGVVLSSEGDVTAAGTITGNAFSGGTFSPTTINLTGALTTTDVITIKVTGDANARQIVNAGGPIEWGDGTAAVDTNLYRSAANTLKTDDALTVAGLLTGSAGAVVTGNGSVSANLLVGDSTALGDNGTGEIQLKDVTSAPTTNPTAGSVIYSTSTAATPLKMRDTSGNVRGLVTAWAKATGDQTSVGTGQTASTFLLSAVEANAKYKVEAWVYWTTAGGSTVTTSWTGPAAASMIWNDTTTGGDVVTTLTGTSPAWATGTKMVNLFGVLETGANAGTLTFTWASSVSASATVKAGSYLFLERIA